MVKTIRDYALGICEALYNKKAENILLLDISDKSVLADYFVICSGRSNLQVKALCDELEEKTGELGLVLRRKDGYQEGRWIVMDYADILVHIFHPEERQYYNIERLWQDDDNMLDFSQKKLDSSPKGL